MIPVPDPNLISFKEGDMKTLRIIVPDTLDMSKRKALIQVKDRPKGRTILEFSTEDPNLLLRKNGQILNWVIPAFMSVGKAGKYIWEIAVYTNSSDVRRRARGPFEIGSSIVELPVTE